MDLASAPHLFRNAQATGYAKDRAITSHLLSSDEIATPQFENEWQDLANRASEPNPFFEPWFLLPSLRAFFAGHRSAFTMFALRHGSELVGIIPLVRDWTYYGYPVPHIRTWLHDNAFCGSPLVACGYEEQFWTELLSSIVRRSKVSLFVHLPGFPTDGPLHDALRAVLAKQHHEHAAVETNRRAFLKSDLSAEDYIAASMSTKKRKELRRQRKRLSEEGALAFERLTNAEGIDNWTAEFLRLEAAGWKGDAGSALANAADTHGFFAEAMLGAAQAGRLERLSLTHDGKPIAMLVNLVCAPGAFSFKTAYDEAYARFSPGMLLQLENLALLDRLDIDWADSCAAEGHPMIERLWREKRTIASINIAIGGPLRRTITRRLMAHETRKGAST